MPCHVAYATQSLDHWLRRCAQLQMSTQPTQHWNHRRLAQCSQQGGMVRAVQRHRLQQPTGRTNFLRGHLRQQRLAVGVVRLLVQQQLVVEDLRHTVQGVEYSAGNEHVRTACVGGCDSLEDAQQISASFGVYVLCFDLPQTDTSHLQELWVLNHHMQGSLVAERRDLAPLAAPARCVPPPVLPVAEEVRAQLPHVAHELADSVHGEVLRLTHARQEDIQVLTVAQLQGQLLPLRHQHRGDQSQAGDDGHAAGGEIRAQGPGLHPLEEAVAPADAQEL
mmetsp:Transcript_41566/g.109471  ORF Transcript_41566/g.109471 Transcript_41566/m.109471 type:complete len:278 (-) Transcript_41566:541-1374(-)